MDVLLKQNQGYTFSSVKQSLRAMRAIYFEQWKISTRSGRAIYWILKCEGSLKS